MVDAAMERGCELIPHNFEQGELLTNFYNDPEKEEELIKRTLKVFEETTRTKPQGWLSSSLRGTLNTADILVRNGLKFYCDTMNDDQPYMIETPSGEITAVPYNNEINDFTLLTRRGLTTDEFRDILLEEMSVLYEESATTAKIMNIGLHPHVSGRAYRIRAIKEFIQEAQKLQGVWWTTRSDLTDWYATCQQEHIPRSP
jgi:peptidoglycan/xylan/chitin deacetylase (PgdA/CDA1 family)